LVCGCSATVDAITAAEQEDQVTELLQFVHQENVDAVEYLQQQVLPKIAANNGIK